MDWGLPTWVGPTRHAGVNRYGPLGHGPTSVWEQVLAKGSLYSVQELNDALSSSYAESLRPIPFPISDRIIWRARRDLNPQPTDP